MSDLNLVLDPVQRKLVSGPEAGQNVSVDGFEVNFIGGGTDGTVYNAGAGLTLSGNVFAADVGDVGFGLQLDGGTASYARYRSIETVTGGTVTLMAGHAYKAYATTSPLTITAEDIPADKYGQEGHLEIYLANASYVVADPQNVVLRDALEPDSVNNLTARFHDGLCILSAEDHFAGYIVISATGTAAGSLPYAISSSTQKYVAFDATTNGAVIDLSGAVASGEKHLVGNGYEATTLTGSINCASKTTFAALAMSGVVVTGGTATFGDVYVPQGATVFLSGGRIAIEKTVGPGTVDFNKIADVSCVNGASVYASGCTFVNCTSYGFMLNPGSGTFENCKFLGTPSGYMRVTAQNGLAEVKNCVFSGNISDYYIAMGASYNGHAILTGCTISGNKATYNAAGINVNRAPSEIELTSCVVSGNICVNKNFSDNDVRVTSNATLRVHDGNRIGEMTVISGGHIVLDGSNAIDLIASRTAPGSVTISSGAEINLTSSIVPGGTITVLDGGCTVNGVSLGSAGGSTTYTSIVNSGGTLYIDGEPIE